MPEFMPGLALSEAFYQDAIQPLMREHYPGLAYAAARLDWGSDVLGFDTPMSMDHGWGPKVTLFLDPSDFNAHHKTLDDLFANQLPLEVRGFPTHFGEPYSDGGVMQKKDSHPIHHMVTITTIQEFFKGYLGLNIESPITPAIWLALPQQKLRTLRAGRIYHDDQGLENFRQRLNWYPDALWRYLLACAWQRINQDEPFLGRTGSVGDELGSRLLGARLIRESMRLSFLMSREYFPYTKWFGTAFDQLPLAPKLRPHFQAVLDSQTWKEREAHLTLVYRILAETHNSLKITPLITVENSSFYSRPFLVPHSDRFVEALLAEITDPEVKRLPRHLGNVDQISDNTDVLEDPHRCQALIQDLTHQQE